MKLFKFFSNKHGIYFQWLITYFFILLLPIVINSVMYFHINEIVESETKSSNSVLLNQLRHTVDTRIEEMQKLALQIASNTRINIAATNNSPQSNLSQIQYYNLTKSLREYSVNYSYISDVYIYYHNIDKVVSKNTQFTKKDFYDEYHKSGDISFDDWQEMLSNSSESQPEILYILSENNHLYKNTAFFQSIPINDKKNPNATLVVLMNEAELTDILNNSEWMKKGESLILNENNEIIASSKKESNSNISFSGIENQKQGFFYQKENNEKMAVSYLQSDKTNWKYVTITPSDIFWGNTKYLQKILIIGIIICLALGSFMAIYLLRKNYAPMKQMIMEISREAGSASVGKYSEYELIKQYFTNTFIEKEKLYAKLEKHDDTLREIFLLSLLKKPQNEAEFKKHNISFYSPYFSVVLFYLEDYSILFPEDVVFNGNRPIDMVKFIIKNVVSETFEKKHQTNFTEADGYLVCIINYNEKNIEDCETVIKKLLEYIYSFFKDTFNVYFTLAVSSVVCGAGNINIAYQETGHALDYRMVMGKSKIIFYNELPKNSDAKYLYSLAMEQKLISNVKTGNLEVSLESINEIFNSHFDNQIISAQMAKCFVYDISSTFIKIVNFFGENEDFIHDTPVKDILMCDTILDLKDTLIKITEDLCIHIKKMKESLNLSDRVMLYVNENYADPDINVNSIGNKFGLTPSYLSKLFKAQTGEVLPDYINMLRMEEGKRLLLKNRKNISEIAVIVGYVNSNAFIRAFKKHVGITPGQFREDNK